MMNPSVMVFLVYDSNQIENIQKITCEQYLPYFYTEIDPLPGFLQVSFESSENYKLRGTNEGFVPMNTSTNNSFMGKLSFHPSSKLRMNLMYTQNNNEWRGYSHYRKYNPFGRASGRTRSGFYSFQLNYMINNSMFFDIKLSNIKKFTAPTFLKIQLTDDISVIHIPIQNQDFRLEVRTRDTSLGQPLIIT